MQALLHFSCTYCVMLLLLGCFLTSVLVYICYWFSCMLGQLILPLINTPVLLFTPWILSRNSTAGIFIYHLFSSVTYTARSRENGNLHLKQYRFDILVRLYSFLVSRVCASCWIHCLAHLCFLWNSSVSPELGRMHHCPVVVVLWPRGV